MAGSGPAIDRHRAQIVVTNDRRRGGDELNIGDRAQRDQIALRCAYPYPKDVSDPLAVRRIGLDLDLPGAAKAVEVVDVGTAHRGLQCAEDVADRDTQSLGPLA